VGTIGQNAGQFVYKFGRDKKPPEHSWASAGKGGRQREDREEVTARAKAQSEGGGYRLDLIRTFERRGGNQGGLSNSGLTNERKEGFSKKKRWGKGGSQFLKNLLGHECKTRIAQRGEGIKSFLFDQNGKKKSVPPGWGHSLPLLHKGVRGSVFLNYFEGSSLGGDSDARGGRTCQSGASRTRSNYRSDVKRCKTSGELRKGKKRAKDCPLKKLRLAGENLK